MTPRLVTVSWTTETGHEGREHIVRAGFGTDTLCGRRFPKAAKRGTTCHCQPCKECGWPEELCQHCLRKLKKGAEAMEASK